MKYNTITMESEFHKKVMKSIKNYKELVLAFSGGIDSTVLLDILYNINYQIKFKKKNINSLFKLRAIHVHHGLSHYADYWAKHCSQECQKRNIRFNLIHIDCKTNNTNNIEATARQLRYQYLFNNLHNKEILLTAQHLDDQAETFLLALKRGSGPAGLSGMPKKKYTYTYQLLRPLLQCTKEQIQTYAFNKKLEWITDNSNTETRFDRNFLRLNIFPILKSRWPQISQTIARSAQICAEQEKLLNELLSEELKKICYHDYSLILQPLINMSTEKRQALLRRWIAYFNISMPSYKKLYHIWKDIALSKQDARPVIQLNKQFLLRRFQNRLYVVSNTTKIQLNNLTIPWNDNNKTITLPHQLGMLILVSVPNIKTCLLNQTEFDSKKTIFSKNYFLHDLHINIYQKTMGSSIIRGPYKKEKISIKFKYLYQTKIHILGRTRSRKIKKIWQELKIPPWMRDKIPLLFYNNKLITAVGIFVTHEGNIKNTDKIFKINWILQN